MTEKQWRDLLRVVHGTPMEPLPVGLIVDSPWLADWNDVSVLDYFTDDDRWLRANFKALWRFPNVTFLPGFWAEYGMCTEPSAFGARCVFPENELPFVRKMLNDYADVDRLTKPDCRTDGLCPFAIKRLVHCRDKIEEEGHRIYMATSRGPLNIASYLLGHTELLIGVRTNPEEVYKLLGIVTEFIVDWLRYQASVFPTIDGILVLDDLIGFLGPTDFKEFVVPYFEQISGSVDVSVKALHNDCHGLITAGYLSEMGFNLFNFSFEHSLGEIRRLAGDSVVLLGNIPPRDVLALGSPDDVRRGVAAMLASIDDKRRLICSCGGGTPPGVSSENLDAFCAAVFGVEWEERGRPNLS